MASNIGDEYLVQPKWGMHIWILPPKFNFQTFWFDEFSFSAMLEKKLRNPSEQFLEIQKMIPEMLATAAIRQPVLNAKLK